MCGVVCGGDLSPNAASGKKCHRAHERKYQHYVNSCSCLEQLAISFVQEVHQNDYSSVCNKYHADKLPATHIYWLSRLPVAKWKKMGDGSVPSGSTVEYARSTAVRSENLSVICGGTGGTHVWSKVEGMLSSGIFMSWM